VTGALPSALVAACLALACAGVPAVSSEHPEPYSGEKLIEICSDPEQTAHCAAYIEGVRSGIRAHRLMLARRFSEAKQKPSALLAPHLQRESFCIRDGVALDELVGVVVAYIRANPDQHRDSAAFAIVSAFENAYPCGA